MMRSFLSVYIFMTLVLLPAHGAPTKQSVIATRYIESGSLVSIKSIALLEVPNPAYYNFGDNTGTGAFFFGTVGGLAEESAVGGDSKEYGNFNFAKITQETLKKHLQKEVYEIFEIAVTRKNKFGLVENYNSVKIKGVDALLDIAPVEIGYKQNDLAGVFSSEFGPIISVVVRLISAETREVLYADTIRYGWKPTTDHTDLDIESPPEAQFKNNNDLKTNRKRAIEQLIRGIEAVSMHIAGNLSKYPSIPDPELDSDDKLLFVGKAAEEIATKNYDAKLWQEAQSLANGDTVKRKGIYIKLRSEQLADEKLDEQYAGGQLASGTVLSGIYVSDIKRGPPWMFFDRKPWFTFEQNGNEIIGTDVSKNGSKIYGIRNGDTIKFKYWGRFRLILGEWKINPDGTSLEGTWEADNEYGSWKLTRMK